MVQTGTQISDAFFCFNFMVGSIELQLLHGQYKFDQRRHCRRPWQEILQRIQLCFVPAMWFMRVRAHYHGGWSRLGQ